VSDPDFERLWFASVGREGGMLREEPGTHWLISCIILSDGRLCNTRGKCSILVYGVVLYQILIIITVAVYNTLLHLPLIHITNNINHWYECRCMKCMKGEQKDNQIKRLAKLRKLITNYKGGFPVLDIHTET